MTSVVDTKYTSLVFSNSCRPELFTVSSGAYRSNIYYGVGAIPQVSYNGSERLSGNTVNYVDGSVTAEFPAKTILTYRKRDDTVMFELNIDIDTTKGVPTTLPNALSQSIATGSEVRIRGLPINENIGSNMFTTVGPSSYSRFLPPMSSNFHNPIFREVQIYNTTTVGSNVVWQPVSFAFETSLSIPTQLSYELEARLLGDGTIALYFNVGCDQPGFTSTFADYPLTFETFNGGTGITAGLSNPTGTTTRIVIKGEYFSC